MPSFVDSEDKHIGIKTLIIDEIQRIFRMKSTPENIDRQITNINFFGELCVVGCLKQLLGFILESLKEQICTAKNNLDTVEEEYKLRIIFELINTVFKKKVNFSNQEALLKIVNDLNIRYEHVFRLREATEYMLQNFSLQDSQDPDSESMENQENFIGGEYEQFDPQNFVTDDDDVENSYQIFTEELGILENDKDKNKKMRFALNSQEYVPKKKN